MAEDKPKGPGARETGEDSRLDTSERAEFAGYVFDHLKIFRQMAENRDLPFLSYLLEMSTLEAARIRDGKEPRR